MLKVLGLAFMLATSVHAESGLPAVINDRDISDNFDYLYGRLLKLDTSGVDLSSYLNTSSVFSGDVTGTYSATVVGNDSHSHGDSTLTGLSASKLTGSLPAIDGSALTGLNIPSLSGVRYSTDSVSTGLIDLSTVTTALSGKVSKSGDTMSGQLTVQSSITATAGFYGNGSGLTNLSNVLTGPATFYVVKNSDYLVAPASFTYLSAVPNTITSSLTVTGSSSGYGLSVSSNVYIVGYSSASAYYGDGSHLTGVAASGSGSGNVTFATDNLSPSCNGSNTAFTLAATPLTNSELITKNGIVLQRTTDYSLTGAALTMNTAPASGTLLYAGYAVSNASTSILSTTNTWTAGQTFTGANTFSNPVTFSSSVVMTNGSASSYLGVTTDGKFRFVDRSTGSFKIGVNPDYAGYNSFWSAGVSPTGTNYFFLSKDDGSETWSNVAAGGHNYITDGGEITNMPINIYNHKVMIYGANTNTAPKAVLDVNGSGYFGSSVTVAAGGLYVGGTTSGYGVSAHGVCIGTSAVTSTTDVTRTCTGLPASLNATGVAMSCIPNGSYSTASDVLMCIPNGTADQVTCHTSGANTTARTISCMWMKQ